MADRRQGPVNISVRPCAGMFTSGRDQGSGGATRRLPAARQNCTARLTHCRHRFSGQKTPASAAGTASYGPTAGGSRSVQPASTLHRPSNASFAVQTFDHSSIQRAMDDFCTSDSGARGFRSGGNAVADPQARQRPPASLLREMTLKWGPQRRLARSVTGSVGAAGMLRLAETAKGH